LRWAEMPSKSPLVNKATMTKTMASSTSEKPLLRCGGVERCKMRDALEGQ